jgi:glutathione synthase/RimK-type ligase-like ATP-grasp enzyme
MNPAPIVEWNFHKGYLKDLEKKGVAIVPTVFFKETDSISLPGNWNYQRFIIKPAISANAYKTVIISQDELLSGAYKNHLAPGDWLLQPFMEEIKQGEVSLHFFNKTFSHGITKTPKAGDFRVQEEHGGLIQNYTPSAELLATAQNVLTQIPSKLLYARVDLVFWQGHWVLMEVELIEPALYFRMDPQSVVNYKRAIDEHFSLSKA